LTLWRLPSRPFPVDSWHDDRLDLERSTACFASRIKRIKNNSGSGSWLMAAAAYVSSPKTVQERTRRWNTKQFWDLPLPEPAETLVARWIALAVINSNRKLYGISVKESPPLAFDSVTGLVLAKDVSIAEIARMTGVNPRKILDLNPRIKTSKGIIPATSKGKSIVHSLSAPTGKGNLLVQELRKKGYLADRKLVPRKKRAPIKKRVSRKKRPPRKKRAPGKKR
ncbi:hypothetical protein ACFL2Q_19220, partial [Thermodesulfobacteriota bacterium]